MRLRAETTERGHPDRKIAGGDARAPSHGN